MPESDPRDLLQQGTAKKKLHFLEFCHLVFKVLSSWNFRTVAFNPQFLVTCAAKLSILSINTTSELYYLGITLI